MVVCFLHIKKQEKRRWSDFLFKPLQGGSIS